MGKGKFLFFVAITTLATAFVRSTWDWLVSRLWDEATNSPDKVLAAISQVLQMTAPFQEPLLWFACGIFFALLVGYWAKISTKMVLFWRWAGVFAHVIWRSRPGTRKILHGLTKLKTDETTKLVSLTIFTHPWNSHIEWWPKDDVVCSFSDENRIWISRVAKGGDEIDVTFVIHGRNYLIPSLKRAWEIDMVGMQMMLARAKAKASDQRPQSPQDKPTETPP